MLKFASAAAFLLAGFPSISGFSASIRANVPDRSMATTALNYHPATFDRAVDCVNSFGMCDVDELMELSDELEMFQGCFYESDPQACEKEMDDRKDLADALLLQGELRERNRYVQEGNLFAYDVKADSDMIARDDFFDRIAPSLDL